ncbi:hypothetical protein N1851_011793 [Merluccius polli]|uniref:Uncharacterized protein n=1 Tax=Merluccius polli TaxID=89951 RepID=A0AA47P5F4_MERPO|nr:hypothetical protein N1851_011793 [Merluccius polli]
MNHSVNSSSTLEYPDVMYAACVITLSLVPPINIYALLLILSGGLETITSDFSCLNLAVSDTLMCFFCLFYVIYVQQVLWALKQPGPGEGRTQRAEGYDAKRRAFNIIMITTVVTRTEPPVPRATSESRKSQREGLKTGPTSGGRTP